MKLFIDRLHVEITTQDCAVSPYETIALQASLKTLADLVRGYPDPVMRIEAIYHPDTELYHIKSKLTLPGTTVFSREKNSYLDTALEWCVRSAIDKTQAYLDRLDHKTAAECRNSGKYRPFRAVATAYKEWLRKRVGRLGQRKP